MICAAVSPAAPAPIICSASDSAHRGHHEVGFAGQRRRGEQVEPERVEGRHHRGHVRGHLLENRHRRRRLLGHGLGTTRRDQDDQTECRQPCSHARRTVPATVLVAGCCELICPRQQDRRTAPPRRHCRGMTNDDRSPLFDHRLRERFLSQRVLVLDGALDDDNGTVLATQLLSLAERGPQEGHRAVDPLAGRLGAVDAGDPRRDAAGAVRRGHARARAGVQRRAVPAVGGHTGQALRPAARPDPDAPGVGGHRRLGRRGRGAGRRPAAHPRHRARAHRRGHRPARRPDLRRLAARPLVHRRTGAGVRLHRPHRREPRAGRAGAHARTRTGSRQHEHLHHPQRDHPHPGRRADHGRLLAPAVGADRLPRHGDRLRRGERVDRAAAAPGGGQPGPARSTCTSTPRAATRPRCSRCTTPCATSRRRWRRRASARPSRPARCCSPRASPGAAPCCRTPGSCCTSPRRRAAARSRT